MSSQCKNGCGFYGSPTTLNLCSKCYRDHCSKAQPQQLTLDFSKLSINDTKNQNQCVTTTTEKNRCSNCSKRVGLLGFKCRCGKTFCSLHRYAEEHGCTFDYKGKARAALAKANPIVKADKLQRI